MSYSERIKTELGFLNGSMVYSLKGVDWVKTRKIRMQEAKKLPLPEPGKRYEWNAGVRRVVYVSVNERRDEFDEVNDLPKLERMGDLEFSDFLSRLFPQKSS